jgi:hypothetical protein
VPCDQKATPDQKANPKPSPNPVPFFSCSAALLLTGIAAVFPPSFTGVDVGRAFSDIQEGVRKLFEIRGTLSFFTLVTTIIFFGQGASSFPYHRLNPHYCEAEG